MDVVLSSYMIYLAVTVLATICVGWFLYHNGGIFLREGYRDERLARAVNRLLIVGFYLLNLGFVAFALRFGSKPQNPVEAVEFLSTKIGLALFVLGAAHFLNLHMLGKLRRRSEAGATPATDC